MKSTIALFALGALMIAPILAAPVMRAPAVEQRDPGLVGFGCGPDKATMYAAEEDEFTVTCEQIERITLDANGHDGL